ncbi:tumor suppressor, Mitostatin-domain-containing protein [Dunaliella salina]|uniref:Cilia- and flagella-associated protein 45 n=1 Tax=Dunaliella salina TaxID=3046 RepID=A0ABQ7FUS3_DUNSA|nr:tumor suppressor, Mitostatin-domain-containing protein [Dunaliella salina]|eukprot:KAF5826155.1 tumor suppressor, Mitostatin-domain-containing protein [Dunaliella salina]
MPSSRGSNGSGSIAGSTRSGFRAPTNPKPSYVDESLFGGTKTQGNNNSSVAKAQVEALEKAAATAKKTRAPQNVPDVVTLSKADLDRMTKASPVMSAADLAEMKKTLQMRKEEAQAVSKARKEKMLKLEEEAKKKKPETETERLKAATNKKLQSHAEHQLEEEKDAVKNMNQMMLYSKCVTIRDAQIEEKKQAMLETEDENRRQDLMMEIERIKALEQYEAREQQRNEERRRGAKVLEDQIAQREHERIRQEELRDQERIQMLREAERLKEEELQQAIEKKMQAQALLSEVAAANAEQIRRKELLKVREKEEDMKILEYIRAKDAREQELAYEKERIRHEKEMETVRLRTMQERAADKQAELDELRARRYQETKEREWRAKEKAAAERHATMQRELEDAREAQKAAKMLQRAEMAKRMRIPEGGKKGRKKELQGLPSTI